MKMSMAGGALVVMLSVWPATLTVRASSDAVVQLPTYVVKGDRELPPAQSWRYVAVPSLDVKFKRGSASAQGFEILSNMSEKNTRAFVEELQRRQMAGILLWPGLIGAQLPQPTLLIIDRSASADFADEWKDVLWSDDSQDAAGEASQLAENLASEGARGEIRDSATYTTGAAIDPNYRGSAGLENVSAQSINPALLGLSDSPESRRLVENIGSRDRFIYIVRAGTQDTGSNSVWIEDLAAVVSASIVRQTLVRQPAPAMLWLQDGLCELVKRAKISQTRVELAKEPAYIELLNYRAMPPLAPLFGKEPKTDFHSRIAAAVFVQFCLYGERGKYADRFQRFVEVAGASPTDGAFFKQCFGMGYSKMEAKIADALHSLYVNRSVEYRGRMPDLPSCTVREATQAEVARLQAETSLAKDAADRALDVLRIAFLRGEREPRFLAMLAEVEAKIGSEEKAGRLLAALFANETVPPRAHLAMARLRYRQALKSGVVDGKLKPSDSMSVYGPLARTVGAGYESEDLYALAAEVTLHTAGRPPAPVVALLRKAATIYRSNATIVAACQQIAGGPFGSARPETTAPVTTKLKP